MTWRATVLTLFPEMFPGPLGLSLAGKALAESKWALQVIDIRDFSTGKHRSVDDAPFGGGAGMVLMPEPVFAAVEAVDPPRPLLYLSPAGRTLDQSVARELATSDGFSSRSRRAVPTSVPEVPTPATRCVTRPSVWAQISTAVP